MPSNMYLVAIPKNSTVGKTTISSALEISNDEKYATCK